MPEYELSLHEIKRESDSAYNELRELALQRTQTLALLAIAERLEVLADEVAKIRFTTGRI